MSSRIRRSHRAPLTPVSCLHGASGEAGDDSRTVSGSLENGERANRDCGFGEPDPMEGAGDDVEHHSVLAGDGTPDRGLDLDESMVWLGGEVAELL